MANTVVNFINAKKKKDDEFYTPYDFVKKELDHYDDQFKGKSVYCPCDDPRWSAFPHYLINRYDELELKFIICTFVDNTDIHKDWIISYGIKELDWCEIVYDDEADRMLEEIKSKIDLHGLSVGKVIVDNGRLF